MHNKPFFDIRTKFNYFHINQHAINFQGYPKNDKNRLFHCSIIAQKKDYDLVKNTFELVYLKYNLDGIFEDEINIIKINDKYILNINIALFYHIIDPLLFGHKVEF